MGGAKVVEEIARCVKSESWIIEGTRTHKAWEVVEFSTFVMPLALPSLAGGVQVCMESSGRYFVSFFGGSRYPCAFVFGIQPKLGHRRWIFVGLQLLLWISPVENIRRDSDMLRLDRGLEFGILTVNTNLNVSDHCEILC